MKIKLFFLSVVILVLAKFANGAPQDISTESPQYPEGVLPEKCNDAARRSLKEKKLEIVKFRIYEKTGECYLVNDLGPCEQNMIFAELEGNKTYGICDCDRNSSPRFLIRHEEKNECYFIFGQAYCNDGEFLTLNEESKPVCENNLCAKELKAKPGSVFINLALENSTDYKCREVGTSADNYCANGEILQWVSGYVLPYCRPGSVSHNAMSFEKDGQNSCSPGSSASAANGCATDRTAVRLRVKG